MKDIAIYGAGGLGREVACMLIETNKTKGPTWNIIGFFDDGKKIGESVSHFGTILGGINELNSWRTNINVVICMGIPAVLKKVVEKITNPLVQFPNIIAPSFYRADLETFKLGKGNIIHGGGYVTTNVQLGDFNLLNGSVGIGHDCIIGSYNCLMPRCIISGSVNIGDCNLIGSNSFIVQGLTVGNNVTLSPLSVLLTKPKSGFTYIGNPAKILKL